MLKNPIKVPYFTDFFHHGLCFVILFFAFFAPLEQVFVPHLGEEALYPR